jgi:hypothetical protein
VYRSFFGMRIGAEIKRTEAKVAAD